MTCHTKSGWAWMGSVLLLTLPFILAGPAAGQEQPADKEYRVLQEREDRLLVVLPNRMIVMVQELKTTPVVSAQVWVKTGSIYEQEHVGAGLSHFLEHLLAGGTTSTRSEEESNQILGQIGAQTNAMTGLNTVSYYINTTRPYAGTAVELLSDWMQNSLITPTEFERERQVIQNEFDMGQGDPGRIMWKLTQQGRYQAHPARHPTIGYLDEFLKITREEIEAFYHRMYVPNNMVFVVVGDVDKQAVVDQIAGLWGKKPAGELPKLAFPREPELTGPRNLQGVADVRAPRLRLAWPGTQLAEEGDYAMDLLAQILGGGESSRLNRTVRDQDRAVNSIDAYNLSFSWGKGYFGIDAEITPPAPGSAPAPAPAPGSAPAPAPAPGSPGTSASATAATQSSDDKQQHELAISKARELILEQVRLLAEKGVSGDELARAKRQTLAAVTLSAQTAQGLASRLGDDVIAMGDPDYLRRYAQQIQTVTGEQVQDVARKFLKAERLITVTLRPTSPDQPITTLKRNDDAATQANLPSDALELDNTAWLARLNDALTRAQNAAAPPVVERPVLYTLPNGLRVLIGRSTVVPGVAMQFYHLGGLLADQPGREGLANAAATMLIKGTATRTAQQIANEVEDLGAGLASSGGNNTFYVQATCLTEDWPKVLELVSDVVLHPAFSAEEWQKIQHRLLAAINRRLDQWSGELRTRFLASYYGGHVWAQVSEGRREAVASFKAEELAQFHRQHLAASEAVLAIVGDVDPKEVLDAVTKLFADLPAKPEVEFNPPQPQAPVAQARQFPTDKPLAAVQIGFGPGIVRSSPDYAAMQVLSKVISDFPTGWLEQALRGQGKGLAYAVGASQATGWVPGYFCLVFNTKPGDVPAALAAAAEVVRKARRGEVSPAELQRAKAAVLTEEFLGKQSNADRAAEAALDLLYGLPADTSEQFLKSVQNMTAQELRAVVDKYLRNPVLTVITHEAVPEEALAKNLEAVGGKQ
ncbi:MAG: insulinase family protein [Phycisphaeraceae bacterium]|nr:insulinase family protein [Phycisphaeraceae bacterium]